MRKVFFWLIFSLGAICAEARKIDLVRTDGSLLQFYFEEPKTPNFPILFVIQGSTCESSYDLFQTTAVRAAALGIGVVAVEKYGITEETRSCPLEYLENNTIHGRISDHLLVVSYIRKHISQWNKKLLWAGGSEGGQVVALTAPLVPETAMIVMLASGGGITMAEELPIAYERLLRREGASEEKIRDEKEKILQQYKVIKSDPTPYKEWLSDSEKARNTYKYWDSVLWLKALPLLETMEVPMLMVHGTEDTSVPIESSDAVAERFRALGKSNLTYKIFPGLDHKWFDLQGNSHGQEVLNETYNWIFLNLPR